jgi:hypothetical protein
MSVSSVGYCRTASDKRCRQYDADVNSLFDVNLGQTQNYVFHVILNEMMTLRRLIVYSAVIDLPVHGVRQTSPPASNHAKNQGEP